MAAYKVIQPLVLYRKNSAFYCLFCCDTTYLWVYCQRSLTVAQGRRTLGYFLANSMILLGNACSSAAVFGSESILVPDVLNESSIRGSIWD